MDSEKDIVGRLRHEDSMNPRRDEYVHEVLGRAAATIDVLRAEVMAWRAWRKLVVRYMTAEIPDPSVKIESLKSAIAATDATGALGKESPNV